MPRISVPITGSNPYSSATTLPPWPTATKTFKFNGGTATVTATYVNSDGNDLGSSATVSQTVLGPGVYASGTQLFIVGANTADIIQVSMTAD